MSAQRPGYKTTEFYITLGVALLGAFLASDILPANHWAMKLGGIAAAALASLGYSVSRGYAKHALLFVLLIPSASLADESLISEAMNSVARVRSGRDSYGSGCLIAPDVVLTCAHVIESQDARVMFPGQSGIPGTLIHIDKQHDLALIRLSAKAGCPCLPLGSAPHRGDRLYSLGCGAPGQATRGLRIQYSMDYEQGLFECASNQQQRQGDSGGPVLNQSGEVVAVLWGSGVERGQPFTAATHLAPMRQQLVQLTQFCRNGVCYPPGYQQYRTVRPAPTPAVRLQPSAPAAKPRTTCECDARFKVLEAKLLALEAKCNSNKDLQVDYEKLATAVYGKVQADAERFRGPAGKDGRDGADGRDGQDGEAGFVTVTIVTESGDVLYRLENLKPNTEVDLPLRMRQK